jgi:NTE family protein
MTTSSVRTALVLAGGGSFGAVQVGMLKALSGAGLAANMVVGTSVGAINGAYFAGNPTPDGAAGLEAIWRALRRHDIFPITWWTLLGFARRRNFLVSSEGVRRLAETRLPYRRLEEARLPMHVVATDILSGDCTVLSEGSAADALVASTAIPAAFAPLELAGSYLADGAITSNTPVRVAVSLGATRLIVLPTGYACALDAPLPGAVASALHALTLLIARQLTAELESLPSTIDYAIVPTLCPLRGSPYDFSQVGTLIDASEAGTRQWLAAGGLSTRSIPNALKAHKHHKGNAREVIGVQKSERCS